MGQLPELYNCWEETQGTGGDLPWPQELSWTLLGQDSSSFDFNLTLPLLFPKCFCTSHLSAYRWESFSLVPAYGHFIHPSKPGLYLSSPQKPLESLGRTISLSVCLFQAVYTLLWPSFWSLSSELVRFQDPEFLDQGLSPTLDQKRTNWKWAQKIGCECLAKQGVL